jgi:hypothetical protein
MVEMRRIRSTCILLALVAAGCSSSNGGGDPGTAGLFSGSTTSAAGAGGSSVPAATDTTLTAATLPDGSPAPTTAGTKSTAPSATNTPIKGAASGHATAGQSGRGFTPTEIRIGFQNSVNLEVGFALVGAEGTPGDEEAITNYMVKWVNENGGIAGRTLVAVNHGTEATSGTWATQAQETCSDLTEDHEIVVAVSSFVGGSDALSGCFAQKGVPYVESNLWPFNGRDYERLGDILYQPGRMNADRWAPAYVDGLKVAGFFERNARLGLLRVDGATFDHLADDIVKPRLASLGLELEKEVVLSNPNGVGDFGRLGAQISNAIVQFRQADVTHLMFLEPAGTVPFFFMPAAESQGYRPRYGMSSTDIPDTQAQQVPAAQLRRSVAVGWMPPSDVGRDRFTDGNAIWKQCLAIADANGIPTDVGAIYTVGRCDAILFWKTVLDRAKSFTRGGIRAAIESLGTSYQSGYTHASRFGPSKHDSAAAYRIAVFESGCECFKYTGDVRTVA